MSIPKVFISYSHDFLEHKQWVLTLATRLRHNGIDAILDQWDLKPGDDLPRFMEVGLTSADRVLMICTDNYVQKANSGAGGVGYEKMIVTADLIQNIDSNKIIPIIRQVGTSTVPSFLRTKLFIDFSKDDQFEFAFDELIRVLHNAPLFEKPEISNNPFISTIEMMPEKKGDPILELMRHVVAIFELKTTDYVNYSSVLSRYNISRILFDLYIDDAKLQGLLTQDRDKDLRLTSIGKQYAIHHNLIRTQ